MEKGLGHGQQKFVVLLELEEIKRHPTQVRQPLRSIERETFESGANMNDTITYNEGKLYQLPKHRRHGRLERCIESTITIAGNDGTFVYCCHKNKLQVLKNSINKFFVIIISDLDFSSLLPIDRMSTTHVRYVDMKPRTDDHAHESCNEREKERGRVGKKGCCKCCLERRIHVCIIIFDQNNVTFSL